MHSVAWTIPLAVQNGHNGCSRSPNFFDGSQCSRTFAEHLICDIKFKFISKRCFRIIILKNNDSCIIMCSACGNFDPQSICTLSTYEYLAYIFSNRLQQSIHRQIFFLVNLRSCLSSSYWRCTESDINKIKLIYYICVFTQLF